MNLKKTILAVALVAIASLSFSQVASADPISVCTGAGCSTTNVTGTIVAGNGSVTITLLNNLTNAQVNSVIQNVSGIYFSVSGYNGGAVTLTSSNSTNSTNIAANGTATAAGAVNPTGWAAGHSGTTLTACVVCAFGVGPTVGPEQTLIGGTGTGTYAGANGSIAGNDPHNPFLVGTLTLVLTTPGVTANSTFSNVVVQFGTEATPPTILTPEPLSIVLLGMGMLGIGGMAWKRRSN